MNLQRRRLNQGEAKGLQQVKGNDVIYKVQLYLSYSFSLANTWYKQARERAE